MGFAEALRTCLAKYATFSGRAARPEYWWFFLFLVLAGIAAFAVDLTFFADRITVRTDTGFATAAQTSGPVQTIVSLALLMPHLAVAWRRMHDTGRSGFYVLLPLILSILALGVLVFGIGAASLFNGGQMDQLLTGTTLFLLLPTVLVLLVSPLVVLVWLLQPGQPGTNAYGPAPGGPRQ
jgi:uncharacterized membrane protein YhaH (DUF805 family)